MKPTTKEGQIIGFLSGIFVLILSLYYIISKIDLIPDGLGFVGYLDDIIVMFLLVISAISLWNRFSERFSRNRKAYVNLWRSGDLIKLLMKPRTWGILLLLAAALSYFFWSLDLVPDTIVGLGYVDDAIAAIGSLVLILKFYHGGRR